MRYFSKRQLILCLMILAFCFMPFISSFADEINYIYDNANRLIRVEYPDGTTTEYTYDAVGNLLSIAQGTVGNQGLAPDLQSINPDIIFIGANQNITITGLNLLTTSSLTSDNQNVTISNVVAQDTSIQATFSVAGAASPGPVTFTVVTDYGSASIQAAISSATLSLSPSNFALTPGTTGTITASLTPPAGRDVTITLNNSDASIVSVPQSVLIPASGTTTFAATPLTEGLATISSGDATVDISVIGHVITTSRPVSLGIDAPLGGNATTTASPVSIYLDTPLVGTATIQSQPASVYIDPPSGNATVMSLPVSTQKAEP
jgi:YD repeat-containing protein